MTAALSAALLAVLAVALLVGSPSTAMARLEPPGARSRRRVAIRRTPSRVPQLVRELPDALEFLAVCLEVGLPMSRAVATVAAVSPADTRSVLDEVAGQMALGRAGPLAWADLKGHEVWGRAAADIARAERSGTSLVAVLKLHADDARQEAHDAATKRARTVGVRSVIPLMACFLPAFVLIGVVPILGELLRDFFG